MCLGPHLNFTLKLQVLVNKALKICLNMPYYSKVYDMHESVNRLPLSIRRTITLLKLMYQYSKDQSRDNELIQVESRANVKTCSSVATSCIKVSSA